MQVKRFEARSMKEALEMVKRELGPNAIILSAKDIGSRFGLVGNGSVEITAAVSEDTLYKKHLAESKMRPETKEKFLGSSARTQRKVMDKFYDKYQNVPSKEVPRPASQRRYIDILDDDQMMSPDLAETRIKSAAQRAWEALKFQGDDERLEIKESPAPLLPVKSPIATKESKEVQAIKAELQQLKQIFTDMARAPQQQAPVNNLPQHPGGAFGLSYDFSAAYEKLTRAGISENITAEILLKAQQELPAHKHKSRGLIDGFVAKEILDSVETKTLESSARIHCFVGPRGSGKTSTMVKMAGQILVEGKKNVALVTADTMKVGAVDQMKIYSQILNVPLGLLRRGQEWSGLLDQLKDYDYVLVDYPGLSMKEAQEIDLIKALLPRQQACEIHLCLPVNQRDLELSEIARRFGHLGYSDLIFTCLDEAHIHGSIYNLMLQTEKPLFAFGVGAKVPDDLEWATKERVLDLIFKLTKLRKMQELA